MPPTADTRITSPITSTTSKPLLLNNSINRLKALLRRLHQLTRLLRRPLLRLDLDLRRPRLRVEVVTARYE